MNFLICSLQKNSSKDDESSGNGRRKRLGVQFLLMMRAHYDRGHDLYHLIVQMLTIFELFFGFLLSECMLRVS